MILLSLIIISINTSIIGSISPFITCENSNIVDSGMFGISITIAQMNINPAYSP